MSEPETRTDREAFVQAILEDRGNDNLRLVYAEWLEEHNDHARAEFIRVQCQLASGKDSNGKTLDHMTIRRLEDRELALLDDHRTEWLGQHPEIHQVRPASITFKRGFPERGEVRTVSDAQALLQYAPTITSLDLWNSDIGTAGAQALAASPHLSGLTSLDLSGNHIDDAGAQALAASPHLSGLTRLDLGVNNIGAAGAEALARSPHLSGLTSLNLWYNHVGDAGAQALAKAGMRQSGKGVWTRPAKVERLANERAVSSDREPRR